jgi:hypothetical protein
MPPNYQEILHVMQMEHLTSKELSLPVWAYDISDDSESDGSTSTPTTARSIEVRKTALRSLLGESRRLDLQLAKATEAYEASKLRQRRPASPVEDEELRSLREVKILLLINNYNNNKITKYYARRASMPSPRPSFAPATT